MSVVITNQLFYTLWTGVYNMQYVFCPMYIAVTDHTSRISTNSQELHIWNSPIIWYAHWNSTYIIAAHVFSWHCCYSSSLAPLTRSLSIHNTQEDTTRRLPTTANTGQVLLNDNGWELACMKGAQWPSRRYRKCFRLKYSKTPPAWRYRILKWMFDKTWWHHGI